MVALPPLLSLMVILVCGTLGWLEARRFRAVSPSLDLADMRGQAPYLMWLIPLALLALAGDAALFYVPELQWHLPPAALIYLAPLSRGIELGVLAFVGALASSAARRVRHPQHGGVLLAGLLFVAAFFMWQWSQYRPITARAPRVTADGVVLQSDGATCVAASAANVLRLLGRNPTATEQEMVSWLGTTQYGTSPGQLLHGFSRMGIKCRVVNVSDSHALSPPAILFVNASGSGAEDHAMVFVGHRGESVEVLNPTHGREFRNEESLHVIWRGHAIELSLP